MKLSQASAMLSSIIVETNILDFSEASDTFRQRSAEMIGRVYVK